MFKTVETNQQQYLTTCWVWFYSQEIFQQKEFVDYVTKRRFENSTTTITPCSNCDVFASHSFLTFFATVFILLKTSYDIICSLDKHKKGRLEQIEVHS